MGRYLYVLILSLLVTSLVASAAPAATITEVMAKTLPFDPTTQNFADFGFGLDGCYLTLPPDQVDPTTNLFKATARPTSSMFSYSPNWGGSGSGSGGTTPQNPAALHFQTLGNTPSGGGMVSSYELGNNNGGTWGMEFSMLIFDPGFTGTEMDIGLQSSTGTTYGPDVLTAAQVQAGMMLTWDITGGAGETVDVTTETVGGDSYAAGFFMQNATFNAPEPATMCLLGLGLAGMALRRRK